MAFALGAGGWLRVDGNCCNICLDHCNVWTRGSLAYACTGTVPVPHCTVSRLTYHLLVLYNHLGRVGWGTAPVCQTVVGARKDHELSTMNRPGIKAQSSRYNSRPPSNTTATHRNNLGCDIPAEKRI